MGQDHSKTGTAQTLSAEDIAKKYEKVEKIENDVQVLLEKGSNRLIALKEFSLTDDHEFQQVLTRFKSKLNLDNTYIIKLLHVLEKKEAQFCSTFYKVQVVYEHVQNTLQREIDNRLEIGQLFSEEELWNILTQCMIGLNYLYSNKAVHANVRPSTIFITKEGVVKVADPNLLSQPTLYAQAITSSADLPSGVYLAPELLTALHNNENNPAYDKQRSDVFSLGMTILHASLLQPLDDVYDYTNATIDENLLISRLNNLQQQYGSNLFNFIKAMTEMNADNRQDITFFDQILSYQPSGSLLQSPEKSRSSSCSSFQQQDNNSLANLKQDELDKLRKIQEQQQKELEAKLQLQKEQEELANERYLREQETLVKTLQLKEFEEHKEAERLKSQALVLQRTTEAKVQQTKQNSAVSNQQQHYQYDDMQQQKTVTPPQVTQKQVRSYITEDTTVQPPPVQQKPSSITSSSTYQKQISSAYTSNGLPAVAAAPSYTSNYSESNSHLPNTGGMSYTFNSHVKDQLHVGQSLHNPSYAAATSYANQGSTFAYNAMPYPTISLAPAIGQPYAQTTYNLTIEDAVKKSAPPPATKQTSGDQNVFISSTTTTMNHARPSSANQQLSSAAIAISNVEAILSKYRGPPPPTTTSVVTSQQPVVYSSAYENTNNIYAHTASYNPSYQIESQKIPSYVPSSHTSSNQISASDPYSKTAATASYLDYKLPALSSTSVAPEATSLLQTYSTSSYAVSQLPPPALNSAVSSLPAATSYGQFNPITSTSSAIKIDPYSSYSTSYVNKKVEEGMSTGVQPYISTTATTSQMPVNTYTGPATTLTCESYNQSYQLPSTNFLKQDSISNYSFQPQLQTLQTNNTALTATAAAAITAAAPATYQSTTVPSYQVQQPSSSNILIKEVSYSALPSQLSSYSIQQPSTSAATSYPAAATYNIPQQQQGSAFNADYKDYTSFAAQYSGGLNANLNSNLANQEDFNAGLLQQQQKGDNYRGQQQGYNQNQEQQQQQQQQQQIQGEATYDINQKGEYYNEQEGYYAHNQQQQQDEFDFENSGQDREYVVEEYQNNSRYEGEKFNGMRDGIGKFFYPDGGMYEGEWFENKMHGKGVLRYASGQPAYDGDWENDKFEGFGVLYNENPAPFNEAFNFYDFDYVDEYWTKYEGQFKDDNKEGFGTLFLSNGEKLVGQFEKDFVHGPGVFYTIDGEPIQNVWQENKIDA